METEMDGGGSGRKEEGDELNPRLANLPKRERFHVREQRFIDGTRLQDRENSRTLRAYFRERTHSVVVGSLLKDFRIEQLGKGKHTRQWCTHNAFSLVADTPRKRLEKPEQPKLRLSQRVQRRIFKTFTTAGQGNRRRLSSRPDEFAGDESQNLINVEAGVHRI